MAPADLNQGPISGTFTPPRTVAAHTCDHKCVTITLAITIPLISLLVIGVLVDYIWIRRRVANWRTMNNNNRAHAPPEEIDVVDEGKREQERRIEEMKMGRESGSFVSVDTYPGR